MINLKELDTERTFDILCELTPYIANIASDDELLGEFSKKLIKPNNQKPTREEYINFGVEKFNKIVPILFKKRKNDVIGIISLLTEKTPSEVKSQSGIDTMKQLYQILRENDIINFFGSSNFTEKEES